MLDKTGTVTSGKMSLVDVVPAAGVDRAEALRLVGALEHASEHPVAQAIAAAAGDALPAPESFRNREGLGVEGVVEEGARRRQGRPARGLGHRAARRARRRAGAGRARRPDGDRSGVERCCAGPLHRRRHDQADERQAIRRLGELGLRPVLLTGDNAATARAVATEVGIDEVVAEVLPAEKVEVVRRLQAEDVSSRWSATESTMRPRSRRRISASRSARMLRSRRAT